MFGIGGQELLFILVLALIVLGPSKLPEIAKTLGKVMGEFNRATSDLKREIDLAAEEQPREPEKPASAPSPEEKPGGGPEDIFKEVREESEQAPVRENGQAGPSEEGAG